MKSDGSNMKSDAEKACEFATQTMEMMPRMLELSWKTGFGDEDSKKEAQKELDELLANQEKSLEELEA